MRHQVAVIAEPFLGLGFRLAGLRHVVAESETAAARRLEEMLSDPRWGVVLVQENLVPEVPPDRGAGPGCRSSCTCRLRPPTVRPARRRRTSPSSSGGPSATG